VSFDKDWCKDNKPKRKRKKKDCGPLVNSQSQSGTACFGSSPEPRYDPVLAAQNPEPTHEREADAGISKKIKIEVKAQKCGNSQAQAQIVQADFNKLEAEIEEE